MENFNEDNQAQIREWHLNDLIEISYADMKRVFSDRNEKYGSNTDKNPLFGIIVFDGEKSGWRKKDDGKPYSFAESAYVTASNQLGWDDSKLGHARFADSLDGQDHCRLDYYPHWVAKRAYIVTAQQLEELYEIFRK